jgi:hypothetical protein
VLSLALKRAGGLGAALMLAEGDTYSHPVDPDWDLYWSSLSAPVPAGAFVCWWLALHRFFTSPQYSL